MEISASIIKNTTEVTMKRSSFANSKRIWNFTGARIYQDPASKYFSSIDGSIVYRDLFLPRRFDAIKFYACEVTNEFDGRFNAVINRMQLILVHIICNAREGNKGNGTKKINDQLSVSFLLSSLSSSRT